MSIQNTESIAESKNSQKGNRCLQFYVDDKNNSLITIKIKVVGLGLVQDKKDQGQGTKENLEDIDQPQNQGAETGATEIRIEIGVVGSIIAEGADPEREAMIKVAKEEMPQEKVKIVAEKQEGKHLRKEEQ